MVGFSAALDVSISKAVLQYRCINVQAAIASFNYSRGATNTPAALNYVRRIMLTSHAGARDHLPKVVIVLTDGKSSDTEATKV